MLSKIIALIHYLRFLLHQAGGPAAAFRGVAGVGCQFAGYPSNHAFRVYDGVAYPSFQLFRRWDAVRRLMPRNPRRILDLACCRGYYLIQGQREYPGASILGVDVSQSFIQQARRAAFLMNCQDADFQIDNLEAVSRHAVERDELFDVVFLTGAYHYFFWDEEGPNRNLGNHDDIMRNLHALTRDRVIISGRLDLSELPGCLVDQASVSERAVEYNSEAFLTAARFWFDVEVDGALGRYPVYVLKKRPVFRERMGPPRCQ